MGSHEESSRLFRRAQRLIPGGVDSPVRAFRAVGGEPFFVDHARGAYLYDVDRNRYIDYVLSWGAVILGHAHESVTQAVQEAATRGTSYGAPCSAEVELAELITESVPSVEVVRFVNSGTEATMSALRLARAVTSRELVVKFDGCYHGHGDSFLVRAGSGVATLGLPDSPGVPAGLASLTLSRPYNDAQSLESTFDEYGDRIACVIMEPVVGNSGFIPPEPEFLQAARRLSREYGAMLIVDEVMTGFRVAMGGAQSRFGIEPDLTTLGKVIGGGLPVAAYGGRRDLMEQVAPTGPVYQAGTLSGNPLGMAAGVAQLLSLRELEPFDALQRRARHLVDGLVEAGRELGVPISGGALGGMWGVHFTEGPVRSYNDAKRADRALFSRFFHAALERGVFIPPSPFEAYFMSTAHTDDDIEQTRVALRSALEAALAA